MRMLATGLAVVLATALGPQGSQSAEAAEKGTSPKKAAVVKYQMFRPDGTPVRSKGQKGGGQNSMVLQDFERHDEEQPRGAIRRHSNPSMATLRAP